MAQMSAAAANPLVIPPNMMPSSSEIMHQAMWLSRAQQLLEEQQKNLKRDGIEDSIDLSTNTNTHGQGMNLQLLYCASINLKIDTLTGLF